jgi:hypothetical protein
MYTSTCIHIHIYIYTDTYIYTHTSNEQLNKKYPDVMINVQRLPPKKLVGSLSPSLIAIRQKSLDAYMQALMSKSVLAQSDEVRDFIGNDSAFFMYICI